MKKLLLVAALIGCSIAAPSAFAVKKTAKAAAPAQLTIRSSPEAQDAMLAMRSLEAKVESGMNFQDYAREVASLNVAFSGLNELLESKGDTALRAQLEEVMHPYRDAKDLWGACFESSSCLEYHFIPMNRTDSLVSVYAQRIVVEFPELNAKQDAGGEGAIVSGNYFYEPIFLNKLWDVAQARGKALRSTIR